MTTKLAAVLVEHKQWMRAWTVLHRLTQVWGFFYSLKIKVGYTLHFIALADFQNLSVVILVDTI